jgi:5,10-methylenetetrahydromethanopterin reductase
LSDDFIDQFAVVGPADLCVDRLSALAELGLAKAIVIGPSAGSDRDEAQLAQGHMIEEVIPHFSG